MNQREPRPTRPPVIDDYGDEWREQAACKGANTGWFFPRSMNTSTGYVAPQFRKRADAVCAECPVAAECLEWAIGNPSATQYGMYAGTDAIDRERIRRRRRRHAKV